MGQHQRDVTNSNQSKAIVEYFNGKGYRLSDLECNIFEQVFDPDPMGPGRQTAS